MFTDDQVIENLDIENIAGFNEFVGDFYVSFSRFNHTGGVIMGDNDGGGGVLQGRTKDLAGGY